ncbi:MAG TPA: class I SAM-dependent methyltransferase, partial [Solirubrobacteraceae bacterium]|nr:class I SAM-dependent methyltransferase [Solirubrobacteraceae bacterium]
TDPYISFVGDQHAVNWSAELEELHEEASREHFIDVWTRRSMLARLGSLPQHPVIVDLGCSTGYLLEDLQSEYPDAVLTGIDLVAAGLRKAHHNVPDARLLQADVCALPLEDQSVDAAVSANLLEHVPDDQLALRELRRVLSPGARGVLVVPAGPGTYDYYDRFLGHERRYARGELASKALSAGLEVIDDAHLGSVLYPPFWLVKQRNRRRYGHLQGDALEARVSADIAGTRNSRVGQLACRLERAMLDHGIRLPFGIRGLTVVRRPLGKP